MKKTILIAALAFIASGSVASAQEEEKSTMFNGSTNLQVFYDLGKDRKYATTTLEGFYSDPWGNTFFFFDHYYANKSQRDAGAAGNQNGSYYEIERCFNFWQNSALAPLSIEMEYDGGSFGSSVGCIGLNLFLHNKTFKNTFNLALLYTQNFGYDKSNCPIKFSGVWGLQDLFGAKGLRFCGFIDIWGIERTWDTTGNLYLGLAGQQVGSTTHFSILTEPQLWYSIGQFFGCSNLNIGGEVELSYNFSGAKQGFICNPCIGAKWVF